MRTEDYAVERERELAQERYDQRAGEAESPAAPANEG